MGEGRQTHRADTQEKGKSGDVVHDNAFKPEFGEAQKPLGQLHLSNQDKVDAHAMASVVGFQAKLNEPQMKTLETAITAGMSGDFQSLARLANPANAKVAQEFTKMMDKLGFDVIVDHPATSHSGRQFDSVNIVRKDMAGDENGIGLQLTHRVTGGKHFFGFEGTQNKDGSLDFFKDGRLSRLQKSLSVGLKGQVDRD